MKARLFTNSMQSGHVARDYIRLVREGHNSLTADTRPDGKAARAVLESFEDQNQSIPADPVVPIKPLVRILTESLRGTPNLVADDDGRMDGARLFKGCKVQLRGIPERQFIIRDIYWDYEETRVSEIGTDVEYVLPWDCLRLSEEQEE